MDEYIKKNQALCCFSGWVDQYGEFHEADEMIEYQRIEQLTAADVVPVVRCKDCRFSDWYTAVDGKRYCYCMETGAYGRNENDFCSYGVKDGDHHEE